MRELTIRIKYNQYSLGNVSSRNGNLTLPRNESGDLVFMPSWHRQNMDLVAPIYGRHQKTTRQILWDPKIDVVLRNDPWYKRTYKTSKSGKTSFVRHEAIFPSQVVGISCLVPSEIEDDDLIALMNLAGKYKGLSPFKPGSYGRFVVDSIVSRVS